MDGGGSRSPLMIRLSDFRAEKVPKGYGPDVRGQRFDLPPLGDDQAKTPVRGVIDHLVGWSDVPKIWEVSCGNEAGWKKSCIQSANFQENFAMQLKSNFALDGFDGGKSVSNVSWNI
jgi:hypothetical protein